jgi:hypothetical protein
VYGVDAFGLLQRHVDRHPWLTTIDRNRQSLFVGPQDVLLARARQRRLNIQRRALQLMRQVRRQFERKLLTRFKYQRLIRCVVSSDRDFQIGLGYQHYFQGVTLIIQTEFERPLLQIRQRNRRLRRRSRCSRREIDD